MARQVGEGFFRFQQEFLGPGYELRRYWVTAVGGSGYRYMGGGVEGPYGGVALPPRSALTPIAAFWAGKRERLLELSTQKQALIANYQKKLKEIRRQQKE